MSFYTLSNLPSGFEYDGTTHHLFNTVNKKTVLVNQDGTITLSGRDRNITLTVDEYVNSIILTTTEAFNNRRNRIVEPFVANATPAYFPIQCNHPHFGTCIALTLIFCALIISTGILLAHYI